MARPKPPATTAVDASSSAPTTSTIESDYKEDNERDTVSTVSHCCTYETERIDSFKTMDDDNGRSDSSSSDYPSPYVMGKGIRCIEPRSSDEDSSFSEIGFGKVVPKTSTEDNNHICINGRGGRRSASNKCYPKGCTKDVNTSCIDSSNRGNKQLINNNKLIVSAKDDDTSLIDSRNDTAKNCKKSLSVSTGDSITKCVNSCNNRMKRISAKVSTRRCVNSRNSFRIDQNGLGSKKRNQETSSKDTFTRIVNSNSRRAKTNSAKVSSFKNLNSSKLASTISSTKDNSTTNVNSSSKRRSSSAKGRLTTQSPISCSINPSIIQQSSLISSIASEISIIDEERLKMFNQKLDAIEYNKNIESNRIISANLSNHKSRKLKLILRKKNTTKNDKDASDKPVLRQVTNNAKTKKKKDDFAILNQKKKDVEEMEKKESGSSSKAAASKPPSIPKKKAYIKTSLCELYMIIQVKVGCYVVNDDENLVVHRAFDNHECKGIIVDNVFYKTLKCNCAQKSLRYIPVNHSLLKFCSKMYKQLNITAFGPGETQKVLNLVTENDLKEYETKYRKKEDIINDSKRHRPPILIQKPQTLDFSLSADDDGGILDLDDISVSPITKNFNNNEEKEGKGKPKHPIKSKPKKQSNRGKGPKKPKNLQFILKAGGRGDMGGRGRGNGGRGGGRGGRGGRGNGGRTNGYCGGGRLQNNFQPNHNQYQPPPFVPGNQWQNNNMLNHQHDNSVAYSMNERNHAPYNEPPNYTNNNWSEDHQRHCPNEYNRSNNPSEMSHMSYHVDDNSNMKRKHSTVDRNQSFSLDFGGVIKSVKLINANDVIKLNTDEYYKSGNKLVKLVINENLFVEPSSGSKYVDVSQLNQDSMIESNAIRVPDSISHVSTIGTNISLPFAPNSKKFKAKANFKVKTCSRGRKKSSLFKQLCYHDIITPKWNNSIFVLDKGNPDEPIRFFYQGCRNKKDCYKKDSSKYTLDNIEWTFRLGNKERMFDSEVILECHAGHTPILDIFSDEERHERLYAKAKLDELEDIRCTKNNASM